MSRLQSTSKIISEATSTPPYRRQEKSGITHPYDIYNTARGELVAHFMSDSIKLADGAAVDTWKDELGGRWTVTQSTAADKPTFHKGASDLLNGYPVLRFGDVTGLVHSHLASKVEPLTIATLVAVHKFAEDPFTRARAVVAGQANDSPSEGLMTDSSGTSFTDAGPAYKFYIDGSTTDDPDIVTPTNWHISMMVKDTPAVNLEGFYIANSRAQNRYMYGDLAEILLYKTTLTEANRTLLFNYLNDKYQVY